jgi:hypothetical protein
MRQLFVHLVHDHDLDVLWQRPKVVNRLRRVGYRVRHAINIFNRTIDKIAIALPVIGAMPPLTTFEFGGKLYLL